MLLDALRDPLVPATCTLASKPPAHLVHSHFISLAPIHFGCDLESSSHGADSASKNRDLPPWLMRVAH